MKTSQASSGDFVGLSSCMTETCVAAALQELGRADRTGPSPLSSVPLWRILRLWPVQQWTSVFKSCLEIEACFYLLEASLSSFISVFKVHFQR